MVTAWPDPSGRPGTDDDGDYQPSSRAVKWDLVDLAVRTQFMNGLVATLGNVKGEDLLAVVKNGPPDAGRFAAHSEPTPSVTRQAELIRLANETYLRLNAMAFKVQYFLLDLSQNSSVEWQIATYITPTQGRWARAVQARARGC